MKEKLCNFALRNANKEITKLCPNRLHPHPNNIIVTYNRSMKALKPSKESTEIFSIMVNKYLLKLREITAIRLQNMAMKL